MLIYMAVPISIMFGLCIFCYMAGRYVHIGKKREVKAPEIIEAPKPPKEPDRVPILEEENKNLKQALENKNRELEEKNKALESVMQENQSLLVRIQHQSAEIKDKQKEEGAQAIEPAALLSQPEDKPAADNTVVPPVLLPYDYVAREPKKKALRVKPGKKVKRRKKEVR